jgi:3-isopropylmalate/(R)-2-methylmalate dehydratase small subunit
MLKANPDQSRTVTEGTAVPVRGDDIDTDRIIPARFAKAATFDALGEGAFADDRAAVRRAGGTHPFDDPRFATAGILLAGANFGCGSSREHAVAAFRRWRGGIRALVGESFAEIFCNNCVANGLPAVTAGPADVEALMRLAEEAPDTRFRLDLATMTVTTGPAITAGLTGTGPTGTGPTGTGGGLSVPVSIPEGTRSCLMDGSWDTLAGLIAQAPLIRATERRLPYLRGFPSRTAPAR